MDINELKNRLSNLNNRTKTTTGLWKPKDEHQVRLCQYPHGDESFIERQFHNDIDQFPFLCPRQFGDECSVCDFAELLRNWKDQTGKDKPEAVRKQDWELFKKIQAKPRFYVPMIERGKESEGVRFWGMTPAQMTQALEGCDDGDRLEAVGVKPGDASGALRVLFDIDKGYDFMVSFKKPGEKGNAKTFTIIELKAKIKSSPLAASRKAADELLKTCKNIKDIFPQVSSSEVDRLFRKFLGNAAPEAKAEGGTEKYVEAAKTNSKENAKLAGTRSIDEAFGDLLSEEEKGGA